MSTISSRNKESEKNTKQSLMALVLGATGVVFGDIGTSPIYALRESILATGTDRPDPAHIYGILSLMFWSILLVVSIKYVLVVMRADNKGEGGSLALLALVGHLLPGKKSQTALAVVGIFAAALFFGDSMITPAISVLSAIEGLEIATPAFSHYVIPLTLVIIVLLFAIQHHGTTFVGFLFGPIICLWFAALATIGILHIVDHPLILGAIDPRYALNFFSLDHWRAFIVLGSVFLVVTGAEALYSDMGHFGRLPIKYAWFGIAMPALLLNYFGQGALVIADPSAIQHPFFLSVPHWALIPMIVLTTLATIIASQAVISGTYSVTRQAIQLGVLPRLRIVHTSATEEGQIYAPFINWLLMGFVCLLVVGFGSSSSLASAYGIAVTGTMLTTSILIAVLILKAWKWHPLIAYPSIALMLIVDCAFLGANATKFLHGGWFPLVIAITVFILLISWKQGRQMMMKKLDTESLPVELFYQSLSKETRRVPGTAVFMTARMNGVPHALLHNMKHNKVIHERNLFVTAQSEDVAHIPVGERMEVIHLVNGLYRVIIRYGFMDTIDIPKALMQPGAFTSPVNLMETSFFLSRETILPSGKAGMNRIQETLFAWMSRNAANAMEFFNIPPNRVVELGTQIEI